MQRQATKKSFSSNKRSDSGNERKKSIHNDSSIQNKSDEELRDFVTKLQFKILKKNEHLAKMKEEIIELQIAWQEDKRNWQNEKCTIERQSEFYKENIHVERLNTQKLQIQVDKLTQLLSDQSKIKQTYDSNNALEKVSTQLNSEIDLLQKENGTLKTQITLLENKLLSKEETISEQQIRIQKLKKKMDQQLQNQLEEKMIDVDKQKKRSGEIKERITELEIKLKNLSLESERIKKDNKYLQSENDQFRIQYEKTNRIIPQLEEQNKRQEIEINDYESQLEKMTKQIRDLTNQFVNEKQNNTNTNDEIKKKNTQIDSIQQELNDQIRLFHQEQRLNTHLKEELETYKDQLDRLQKQSQQLTDAQHKDMDIFEAKIEKISKEMLKLREENNILKSQLQSNKKEQGQYLDNIDQLQKQIRDLKGKNRILVQQHDDLDSRLNELVLIKQQKKTKSRFQGNDIRKQISKLEQTDSSSSFSD